MSISHRLRLATPDDAAAVRSTYAPYVEGTAVSFERGRIGGDDGPRDPPAPPRSLDDLADGAVAAALTGATGERSEG